MSHVDGLQFSERIYRMLLHVYPASYRQKYGPLMAQTFRDLSRDAYSRQSVSALTRFWVQTLADVATTATVEHVEVLFNDGALPDFSVPAVEICDVSKSFEASAGMIRPALCNINLTVQPGEFVAVVGPTGCGKSTMLGLIAGLERPNSGQISVMGKPVHEISRHVGYLFQTDALFPWRTVLNNVLAGLLFRGVAPDQALEMSHDWIRRVGLVGFENYYPNQLSGGMRKRVALAQSLILQPAVLLMDEPFSDLDAQTRVLMEDELLDLCASTRVAVVFVTHDIEEAIALANRVIVMTAGPASIKDIYPVDIPRPRKVSEVRFHHRFADLYKEIWEDLRSEVLKNYDRVRQPEIRKVRYS